MNTHDIDIDRELLELAAKAAGYDISHPWNAERMVMPNPEVGLCIPDISTCWNPLADDGDALRLAVRLGILLRTDFIKILAQLLDSGMDHQKATRRAIVRVAAEIGRNMK